MTVKIVTQALRERALDWALRTACEGEQERRIVQRAQAYVDFVESGRVEHGSMPIGTAVPLGQNPWPLSDD